MQSIASKRQPIRLWCIFILAVLGMAGCLGLSETAPLPERLKRIQSAGKLVVGTAITAPFEYRNPSNNDLVGFDVDLVQSIAKRLNVKVEWKEMAFADLLDTLRAGKVDLVISAMYITDERKKIVDFSKPYLDTGLVIAVHASTATIHASKDLAGKVVGVKEKATGDLWAQTLRDQQGVRLEIRRYERTTDSLEDLSMGRLDAVFNDKLNTLYHMKSNSNIKIVGDILAPAGLGIAFRKDDPALRNYVDAALEDLKKSGDIQRLLDKWITPSTKP